MTGNRMLQDVLHAVRRRRAAELVLVGLPWLAVLVLLAWRVAGIEAAVVVAGSSALALSMLAWRRARTLDSGWLVRALDRRRADMDDSSDLLFADPAALNGLERLQAERLRRRLEQTPPPDLRPAWSVRAISVSVVFGSIGVALVLLWPARAPDALAEVVARAGLGDAAQAQTRLSQQQLRVTPPRYTGLEQRSQTELDASAPQGTLLQWTLRFAPQPRAAALVFHDGRRLPLSRQGEDWSARHVLESSALYRIELDGVAPLPPRRLHRLDAVADRSPRVRVLAPEQSLSLVRAGQRHWAVTFEATDDHGIAATARLRVTLAQGSGEDITVREQVLSVHGQGSARSKRYTRQLDLGALGLAPGDDLIVQLGVHDNHAPQPRQARSASLILRWPATAGSESTGLEGMVKQVLPAYFRSQRQIIIDAEALLAQRRKLDAERFAKRSDEIGVDQRILRLRYGQFLGEESDGAPQLPTNDADPAHVDEHPGSAVEPPAPAPSEAAQAFGRDRGEFEAYGHSHDQPEAATLLDPETRSTLKAALDQMWQSELHLRQGDPKQALPYAYRALRHIKQVQQASRIYLARVGTPELPSIDESRRLGGDRKGLARRSDMLVVATASDPALAALWQALEEAPQSDRNTLAAKVIPEAQRWLGANQARLADPLAIAAAMDAMRQDPSCMACRRELRALLWPLLARPPAAVPRRTDADAAGRRYLDALQQAPVP